MRNNEYQVYPDRIREILSILVYICFIAGLLGVGVYYRPNIFVTLLLIVFVVLFLAIILVSVKKIKENLLMYVFNDEGISDVTNNEHIIFLSWDEIMKVEIIPNNSNLQIEILGSKVIEEKREMSKNLKINLMKNGNMVFYNIMIDGFLFRKKRFNEIWDHLKYFAKKNNSQILVNEYEDPLLKKKKNSQMAKN